MRISKRAPSAIPKASISPFRRQSAFRLIRSCSAVRVPFVSFSYMIERLPINILHRRLGLHYNGAAKSRDGAVQVSFLNKDPSPSPSPLEPLQKPSLLNAMMQYYIITKLFGYLSLLKRGCIKPFFPGTINRKRR